MNFKQFAQKLEFESHDTVSGFNSYRFHLQENKYFKPNSICIWPLEDTEEFEESNIISVQISGKEQLISSPVPISIFTPQYPYEALAARAAAGNIIDTTRIELPTMEIGQILRVVVEGPVEEIAVWGYIQE